MEVGQQAQGSVPDGWEVVQHAPAPDGWEVVPTKPVQPSSSALGLQATAAAAPTAVRAVEELATNPAVPKLAATAGRVIGGISAPVTGAVYGGVPGAVVGAAEASKAAWAGGKTGWFTGKLAQELASPVARAADALAPYAQAISTVSGAQGVLDLAQMADQTRKDIGFLGMAKSDDASKPGVYGPSGKKIAYEDIPAAIASKISDLASSLKNNGVPAAEAVAVKLLSDGNPATFGNLMTLYMRAKSSLTGAK